MKTVLITGSTTGMGKATALLFAENGYQVIVHGRDRDRGNEVVKHIQNNEGSAIFMQADLTNHAEIIKLFTNIKKSFTQLDVLVNNVGGVLENDNFYTAKTDDVLSILKINFISAFFCSQEAVKLIKRGSIINVASTYGLSSTPPGGSESVPLYAASKSAILNLTQNLAKLLAPNIRVNAVLPGYTKTQRGVSNFIQSWRFAISKQTLLKRFNTPHEVAEIIYLLATSKALTGTQIIIDGGMVLK